MGLSFLTVFLRVLESDYYNEALLLRVGRLRSLLSPGRPGSLGGIFQGGRHRAIDPTGERW
jgi:hypothetical protein